MKHVMLAIWFCFGLCGAAGAPFQNLSFDEGQTNNAFLTFPFEGSAQGYGPASELLPHWTLLHGSTNLPQLLFNNTAPSAAYGALFDVKAWRFGAGTGILPAGKFGLSLSFWHSAPLELRQTGLVPPTAAFLSYGCVGHPLEVRINDELLQPLPPATYYPPFDPRVLAFDVKRFAGQEVLLSLQLAGSRDSITGEFSGFAEIDGLQFFGTFPALTISRTGEELTFTWPAGIVGVVLEERDLSSTPATWQALRYPPFAAEGSSRSTYQSLGGPRYIV
jgi:hypothetical protein